MSGTYQLLTHIGIAGFGIGLGVALLADVGFMRLTAASIFWFAGYFHFADAVWIPSWGPGRGMVDRIAVAIKGFGFLLVAIAVLTQIPVICFAFAFAGLFTMLFGRILLELVFAERSAK